MTAAAPASSVDSVTLAIIIPTYNAAEHLPALFESLTTDLIENHVTVVDAGSSDETADIARHAGVTLLTTDTPGRGHQMRFGTRQIAADWYLLLHADSVLASDWADTVQRFISNIDNRQRAAYFRFKLNANDAGARRLERMVEWRCNVLGLPYGDQGLLISRELLADCGGVPDLPLMEDVQLSRRLGKKRLHGFDIPLLTSDKRYRQRGYLLRSSKNILFLLLYFFGISPRLLSRWY